MKQLCLALFLTLALATPALAEDNLEKLADYAILLGRAKGCGIKTETQERRVVAWMDKIWMGEERVAALQLFTAAMYKSHKDQTAGKSPDSCAEIKKVYPTLVWP